MACKNVVEVITGDDISLIHPVAENGSMLNIPASAVVTCSIISLDRSIAYTAAVTQIYTQEGASWSNGLINVSMTSAQTQAIADSNPNWNRGKLLAWMETQINTSGLKDTHVSLITIIRGRVA